MSSNLRVAIIGAGPAGIYAAVELLTRDKTARVDVYDRLPTPGGLARSGVSPDHGQRRKVMDVYEGIAIGTGRYHFHGNVDIGKNLSHEQLLDMHHAVIYACGSASDRALGIEGGNLKGSHAATEFVAWYNGHPDFASHEFDLSGERAVVIGNGNVALDVARMLLLGEARLSKTDVADHALKALSESTIKEVVIVGRRGIAQAAFTLPELLELADLDDIDIEFENADFSVLDSDITDTNQLLRLRTLKSYYDRPSRQCSKKLIFKCLASPLSVAGSESVESVSFSKNTLEADNNGRLNAVATEATELVKAQLLVRAVGYKGQAVAGLPFDEARGVMPNSGGRVAAEDSSASSTLNACYVVGWLKRGPQGVLGTNKGCSKETVNNLLEDWQAGRLTRPINVIDEIDSMLVQQNLQPVNTLGWKRIDQHEKSEGKRQDRPRVKLVEHAALLAAAQG